MDQNVREYTSATVLGVAAAVSALLVMVAASVQKEYSIYCSVPIGFSVSLVSLIIMRKRSYRLGGKNLCEKLRDASAMLSFLAVIPAIIAIIRIIMYPETDAEDIIIIGALMIVISMLVQALFWKYAQDIGYLTLFHIILLVISLILMNVAVIICYDSGNELMIVVGSIIATLPILMMFDWQWSLDIVRILLLTTAVIGTAVTVMDDVMQIGQILCFWLPLLFLFFIGFRLKGAFLMYEGKKLF